MKTFRSPLDLTLVAIFLVSAALVLLTNEDPFFRSGICSALPCPRAAQAWRRVIYDLSIGSLVSLIFYWLIVRLPEYQRRQRIKRSFAGRYRRFKEDCIGVMLGVADGTYDGSLVDELIEQKKFRKYFTENSHERWYRFLNKLDQHSLNELKTFMEIFRDEIEFVLNTTTIPEDEPFEFLKRLSAAIRSLQDRTLGYDETKPLENFLFEVFAGFNIVSGYAKQDVIETLIASI
jgi:hypothetical protein